MNPQDVPERVTVRTWERWKIRELARAAQRAYQRMTQVEDWAKDLSASERRLIMWANDNDHTD